jgi:Tfp pilus assembly protein FimT
MKYLRIQANSQAGTTIVELMIATVAFSTLLLLIILGIISFTRDYYRGINASSTQNTAGSIAKAVSQAIQFGNQAPVSVSIPGSPDVWCIGSQAFVYNLGKQVSDSNNSVGLAQVNVPDCNQPAPIINLHEMLQPHMRVLAFNLTQNGNGQLWTVNVKVAYGDNDLLCGGSVSCGNGSPTDGQIKTNAAAIHCKSQIGSQFCAVSNLTTTVERRIPE